MQAEASPRALRIASDAAISPHRDDDHHCVQYKISGL
jgi:hypothetical protein